MYHLGRGMAPTHIDLLRQESRSYGESWNYYPSKNCVVFQEVFEIEKDGKQKYCAGYWMLDQRTKVDRFLLLKNHEIVDKLAGGAVIKTFDVSENWQIWMSEICKEKTTLYRLRTYVLKGMPFCLKKALSNAKV